MPKINKKILFCAAESAPLAKVGGLADVVGSLPTALKPLGFDVRVMMPAHRGINLKNLKAKKLFSFKVKVASKYETVGLYQAKVSGTSYYLLSNAKYLNTEVYSDNSNSKYLFFSRAVIKALEQLDFKPDIVHAHDFHAAAIISELSLQARENRPGLILTIHNLQNQGWVEAKLAKRFSFATKDISSLAKNEKGDWLNLLAAGILGADKITTVSPNYAKEILTPKYAYGLSKLLRSRKKDLVGILNGIDVFSYDPSKDKKIAHNYGLKDVVSGKEFNKQMLRSYFDLAQDKEPLFSFVARFTTQKGLDLFSVNSFKDLFKKYPFQMIFLGTGEKKYEDRIREIAQSLPDNVKAVISFDEALARNLYAASDYFLVPSQFEPCGLTQMIAMRYGALPIVRATGGLKDTVKDSLNGIVFKEYQVKSLLKAMEKALRWYYQDKKKYRNLQKNSLKKDWSWLASAPAYKKLYNSI